MSKKSLRVKFIIQGTTESPIDESWLNASTDQIRDVVLDGLDEYLATYGDYLKDSSVGAEVEVIDA